MGATFNLNVPAGVMNGDYLLMIGTVNSSGMFSSVPSGWTNLYSYNLDGTRIVVYYRVASSELASLS